MCVESGPKHEKNRENEHFHADWLVWLVECIVCSRFTIVKFSEVQSETKNEHTEHEFMSSCVIKCQIFDSVLIKFFFGFAFDKLLIISS